MDTILKSLVQRIVGNKNERIVSPIPDSVPLVNPTPQPSQSPRQVPTEEDIVRGFKAFNPETPLATQSSALREAMRQLAEIPTIDPTLALTIALRESRGGLDLTQHENRREEGMNNPYNVMNDGKLINYPDLQTAILGGENPQYGVKSKGLVGLIKEGPAYEKYRQTGNIDDFNAAYSPPGHGNPTLEQQRRDMEALKRYFMSSR